MQSSTPPTNQYEPVILKALPPEEWPDVEHLITEDGAPVDSIFSEKQMRLLTGTLHSSWKPDWPFVAMANVGLFYGVGIPPIVPDVLLSVNVRLPENLFPKLNRSYFVWDYGKPPEVAIEIVSGREGGEDTSKLKIYADVRVSNYFIYDPDLFLSKSPLRGYRLQGSAYEPIAEDALRIDAIGLGLTIWSGRFEDTDSNWLRWTDKNGRLIPTGTEQAKAEAQRAEAAMQLAKSEGDENLRLLELLRRHGIDPNS